MGTDTIDASTICPFRAVNPCSRRYRSNRLNRRFTSPARPNSSRNNHIVLASGTRSPMVSPRNRMNDNRSRTWYSTASSLRLYNDWSTSTLNINTTSNGFLPAGLFRSFSRIVSNSGRNTSQSTHSFRRTSGSPFRRQIFHTEFNIKQSLYHRSSPSLSISYPFSTNIPIMKENAIKFCTLNRNF